MCSKVRKCEECGALRIKHGDIYVWVQAVAPGHSTVEKDICPECLEKRR